MCLTVQVILLAIFLAACVDATSSKKISGSSTDYTGIFRISCLCVIWVGRWATCKMHYTYTEFAGPSGVHDSNAYEQRKDKGDTMNDEAVFEGFLETSEFSYPGCI